MKLRPDLLKLLTKDDFMEEVLANNHRYQAAPNFSLSGVGTLSSASIDERVQEEERNTGLIRRLSERSRKSGEAKPE